MSTEPFMSSRVRLRVEIALLRLGTRDVRDDSGDRDRLVLAGRSFPSARSRRGQRVEVEQLVLVFLQRMAGDEEAENFLFGGQPLCAHPSRECWAVASRCRSAHRPAETRRTVHAGRDSRRAAPSARAPSRLSSTAINCARRPSESMAPLLISDSSTRLLSRRRSTFSQNS